MVDWTRHLLFITGLSLFGMSIWVGIFQKDTALTNKHSNQGEHITPIYLTVFVEENRPGEIWAHYPSKESGSTYHIGEHEVWIQILFSQVMDENSVLSSLQVDPEQIFENQWYLDNSPSSVHRLRLNFAPATPGTSFTLFLSREARTKEGNTLGRDITFYFQRHVAPQYKVTAGGAPSVTIRSNQEYYASPYDAKVDFVFTKPVNRDSVEKHLGKENPREEMKYQWLDDYHLRVKFLPTSGTKYYTLGLEGAVDIDGVALGIQREAPKLIIVPNRKVSVWDPGSRISKHVAEVSGGYEGGRISPKGDYAVFWEIAGQLGDNHFRYWLENLATGEKLLISDRGEEPVQWYPDGDKVQVGTIEMSTSGNRREIVALDKAELLYGLGLGPNGKIAYLHGSHEKKPALTILENGKEIKTFRDFTYPLIADGAAILYLSLAWSPKGDQIAMVENPISDRYSSDGGQLVIVDVNTSEKTVLIERVKSVVWSPDGRYLAVGKWQGGVEVMTPEGKSMLSLKEYWEPAAWSPNGKYLQLRGRTADEEQGFLEVATTQLLQPHGLPLGWDNQGTAYFLSK
ncbi:hypothetical protein SY88_09810 [Clostridiales bacterium PH28_bin88]|nr:hypothetical protein SY88_09810 [Clostridiales bacterium PH28_bin88]